MAWKIKTDLMEKMMSRKNKGAALQAQARENAYYARQRADKEASEKAVAQKLATIKLNTKPPVINPKISINKDYVSAEIAEVKKRVEASREKNFNSVYFETEYAKNNLQKYLLQREKWESEIKTINNVSWDYKTDPINLNGDPLPPGAISWKPNNEPYFGPTFKDRLKEYWWNYSKDIPNTATVPEMSDLWNKATSLKRSDEKTSAASEFWKNIWDASSRRGAKLTPEQEERKKELLLKTAGDEQMDPSKLTPEEQGELNKLTGREWDASLLSSPRRLITSGVKAILEIWNESSVKTEQALGAYRAVAEEANKLAGEKAVIADYNAYDVATRQEQERDDYRVKVKSGEINPKMYATSNSWQSAKENLMATVMSMPLMVAWNTLNAQLSDSGSWENIKGAWKRGWDSGRILYTQVSDPMIRYEYERRIRGGEDPVLLAMELENPMAELIGRIAVDPLNYIGPIMKGLHFTGSVDDAFRAVTKTGALSNERYLLALKKASKGATDEDAIRLFGEAIDIYTDSVKGVKAGMKQTYGPLSLTSMSNQNKLTQNVSNILGITTNTMIGKGMRPDEIAQIYKFGLMSVSDDAVEAAAGIRGLLNAPRSLSSEGAMEAYVTLRKLLEKNGKLDAGGLLKALKAEDPIMELNKIIRSASEIQYPSVNEMKKAAEAVASGKKVTAEQVKLAKMYKDVPEKIKFFNEHVAPVEAVKSKINSGLGLAYFTYNPGTSIRNFINNTEMILLDAGAGAFYSNGVFLSMTQVDKDLVKLFGQMPEAAGAGGLAQELGSKVMPTMRSVEVAANKRVLLKRGKDAFGKLTDTALIFDDALRQAGMTQKQFNVFKELVKKEGDVNEAIKVFNRMSGDIDEWRTLDFLIDHPTYKRALIEHGSVWDDILEFASTPDVGLEDVDKFFDAKIKSFSDNALQAATDEARLGTDWFSSDSFAKMKTAVEEGLISRDEYSQLAAFEEASFQSLQELVEKLNEKVLTLADDAPLKQAMLEQNRILSHGLVEGNKVKNKADKFVSLAIEYTYDAKPQTAGEIAAAIKKLGLPDDSTITTYDAFRRYIWPLVKDRRSKMWERYFASSYDNYGAVLNALEDVGADVTDLSAILERARELDSLAQKIKSGIYINGKGYEKSDEVLRLIEEAVARAEEGGKSIDIEKITARIVKKHGTPIISPRPLEDFATIPRAISENHKGFVEAMEFSRNAIKERWGASTGSGGFSVPLMEYAAKHSNAIMESKLISLRVAEHWRDFSLLAYNTGKRYADLGLQYLHPYGFWYSRTYKNAIRRLVEDPQIIAAYAKYKHKIEMEHSNAPEWFKHQAKVENLFGVELDHPLFFALEQTLWPLQGITGVDFYDREKRVNTWTATLDDIGKFGPSVWAPIQLATAVYFAMDGDMNTAQRWAGRTIPQTAAIKGITSLLGRPIELDPAVGAFSGDSMFSANPLTAMDPYEYGRTSKALADIQQAQTDAVMKDDTLTPEEKRKLIAEIDAKFIDIAHTASGPEWEDAYRLATNLRAPGQILSLLIGAGFKARTDTDLKIQDMYSEISRLITMRNGMSSDDYKLAWNQLRGKFGPMMDTVLIARKGGDLRDAAYAYNILGRVSPGKTDDIFRGFGKDEEEEKYYNDLRQKFYDDKGDMSKWSKFDKDNFMDAVLQIGTTFAMPDQATKQDWDAAKSASNEMYASLRELYGEDIEDKVSTYRRISDANYEAGRLYLETNPDVSDYLNAKTAMIYKDPLLFKYYGALETISSYYNSARRAELEAKYGKEVIDAVNEYALIPGADVDPRKEWLKIYSEKADRLKPYWEDNAALNELLAKEYGEDIFDKAKEYTDMSTYERSQFKRTNSKDYALLKEYWSDYDAGREALAKEHGKDIFDLAKEYSSIPVVNLEKKKWMDEQPKELTDKMSAYWDELYLTDAQRNIDNMVLQIYNMLPRAPEPLLRQNPDMDIVDSMEYRVSSQELIQQMPPSLIELIQLYLGGEPLAREAELELGYIGEQYNLSVNDVLMIAISGR